MSQETSKIEPSSHRLVFGYTEMQPEVTSAEFLSSSKHFRDICEMLGIPATKRQARKWRNKKGAAYKHANNIK